MNHESSIILKLYSALQYAYSMLSFLRNFTLNMIIVVMLTKKKRCSLFFFFSFFIFQRKEQQSSICCKGRRGGYGWNSVHFGDFQVKEKSGNNLSGNFSGENFVEPFKSFNNSANHSTRLITFNVVKTHSA